MSQSTADKAAQKYALQTTYEGSVPQTIRTANILSIRTTDQTAVPKAFFATFKYAFSSIVSAVSYTNKATFTSTEFKAELATIHDTKQNSHQAACQLANETAQCTADQTAELAAI